MKSNTELLAIIGKRIRVLHAELSFEKISKLREYRGLSARTTNRLSQNTATEIVYEPKDPLIREILGLQVFELAPVCKKCGTVHVTKRCTNHTPKTRPVPLEKKIRVTKGTLKVAKEAVNMTYAANIAYLQSVGRELEYTQAIDELDVVIDQQDQVDKQKLEKLLELGEPV